MNARAQIIQTGSSQTVRLPEAFRFEGSEVYIRKEGDKVVLEPISKSSWPSDFWAKFDQDPEFETPEPLPVSDFAFTGK
jgi:antitoxin VapB